MNKLDELLAIADIKERHAALSEYARSLNVNVARAKKETGEIREEELVVLIFDALQSKKNQKFQTLAIISVGAFLLFAAIIFMGLFSKMMGK